MYDLTQLSPQDLLFFLLILGILLLLLLVTRFLLKIAFPYFFIGLIGLIVGLSIGSLIATPLSKLPGIYGRWLPIFIQAFVAVSVIDLFIAQSKPVSFFFTKLVNRFIDEKEKTHELSEIIVDTSVLIDGRLEEITKTGFIMGKIIIPSFVLDELQKISDSEDTIKRAKGRKGLEILDQLQRNKKVNLVILDDLAGDREPVDSKLVKLAKKRDAKLMTVDYNLNKVAKIKEVAVLNINELTEAIKPIFIPGENVFVKVIQEGKESGQGVGYLTDGTMIVVENGVRFIGKEIECEVIRIYQTTAGKMVFVVPLKKYLRRKIN
jgi:uncharacterized protein YacL